MTKHKHSDDFNNAIIGGDVKLIAAQNIQRVIFELTEDISSYNRDRALLEALAEQSSPDVISFSSNASVELDAESKIGAALIASKRSAVEATAQEQRVVQYEHGITRSPYSVDGLLASTKIAAMTFVESVVYASFVYEAGFSTGIASAAVFGFATAGTTTLLSAGLGGGFYGRYWNYGLQAPVETPAMRQTRRFGRIGSLLTGSAIGIILGISAVVRTTGEPENLQISFDMLQNVFSSMPSVMLMLTGVGFATLSWRTALSAFGDPYPDLSRVGQAHLNSVLEYQTALEDSFNTLEATQARAMDDLANFADEIADLHHNAELEFNALTDDYHRLSGLIDAREATIREQVASFMQAQKFITQTTSDFVIDDISLDGVRTQISPPVRPSFDGRSKFRGDYKTAVNTITEAYTSALNRLDLIGPSASQSSTASQT